MANLPRNRLTIPPDVHGVNFESLESEAIRAQGDLWKSRTNRDLLSFKAQVKDYCYDTQNRRCCYCSSELAKSKRTYDLEHIIDKANRYDLMFTLKNLANACVMCNQAKSTKRVVAQRTRVGEYFPLQSEGYWLVHPYFDEWLDHFSFDDFGRVLPRPESKKGIFTYRICAIHRLNSMRLADHFSQPKGRPHEKLLIQIYDPGNRKRQEQVALLKRIVAMSGNAAGAAIVAIVEAEAGELLKKPARYTSPDGAATWSGFGRKPKWVLDYLAQGGELEELEN